MAATTLKPSLGVQRQFKTIGNGLNSAAKNSVGTTKILMKKTKVKREAIVTDQKLFNKRKENARRRISEDTLEVSQLGGTTKATGNIIENSTKGFLGRIMDAVGSFIVGWLVYNLPNIITMAESLINRIKTAGKILKDFVKNIGKIFTGSARLIGAVLTNLVTLDIFDTSNRVEYAFNDLYNTFGELQTGIEDGINLVTTPLGQMPGEVSAEFGDDQTMPAEQVGAGERTGTVTTSGGGENPKDLKSGAQLLMRKGFSEKGAAYLAGNIQQESGWNAMRKPWVLSDGAGTNKGLISWNRTRITAAEKFLGKPLETATASEQIDWIKEEMKQYGVLKIFQDKNATDTQLKNASYGYIGWGDLGARWQYSEAALQHLRKSGPGSSTTPTPAQVNPPSQTTSAPAPPINPRQTYSKGQNIKGQIGQSNIDYVEVTSLRGNRWGGWHGGMDIAAPTGTYIALRVDCQVVASGTYGGYGLLVDVWVPQYGVQLRFAHNSAIIIRSGNIPAGTSFARVGSTGKSTGPHIHLEADTRKGSAAYGGNVDPSRFVPLILLTKGPNKGAVSTPQISGVQQAAIAQISSPSKPGQQVSPSARRAPQVAIVNDIPQQQMQVPQNVGAQPAPVQIPTVNKSKALNSLIKNHLLLDLAYT